MSFVENKFQQPNMDEPFSNLSERAQKVLLNSWAKGFADIVFPEINEDRFAIMYEGTKGYYRNDLTKKTIGALILKEMFDLSDSELLGNIMCDYRFKYALQTNNAKRQFFNERTFYKFRERLYLYNFVCGIDLFQEEMESLSKSFEAYKEMNPSIKDMSIMKITSSCRDISYLEQLHKRVSIMVRKIARNREDKLLPGFEQYLIRESCDPITFHFKGEEIPSRLEQLTDDASTLLIRAEDNYHESLDFKFLNNVLTKRNKVNYFTDSLELNILILKNKIELTTTTLLDDLPTKTLAGFQVDSKKLKIIACPAGHKPYKTSYYKNTGIYRASFKKRYCVNCLFKEQCGVKIKDNAAFIKISE